MADGEAPVDEEAIMATRTLLVGDVEKAMVGLATVRFLFGCPSDGQCAHLILT